MQLCNEQSAELLGQGGFGQVWRFFKQNYGTMVVRKYFREKRDADIEASWYRLLQDSFAQHPNIIRMLAATQDNDHPAIELEYAAGGTLYDLAFRYDRANNNVELQYCATLSTPRMLRELVTGCLQALRFLHGEVRVIHNDIKPVNILLHNGIAKLADLGLCSVIDSMMARRIGTFGFIAPEVFAMAQENEGKTDIFSLGLTFFEVFEGAFPTPISRELRHAWNRWRRASGQDRQARSNELRREAKRFFDPERYSSRLMDGANTLPGVLEEDVIYLVAEMLRINILKRPTALRCLELLGSLRPSAHAANVRSVSLQAGHGATQHAAPMDTDGSCVPLSKTPRSARRDSAIVVLETQVAPPISETEGEMLRLARAFVSTGACEDAELITLLEHIRVKSNCKRNEYAFRLLTLLHKYPEFAAKRQMLFEAIAQSGKHWWHDHKRDRALLRAMFDR